MFRRKKAPKPCWQPGDFVRVKPAGTTDVELDHHGRFGVVLSVDAVRVRDGLGHYYKVWWGPTEYDWRGYYTDWLEDAGPLRTQKWVKQ